MLIACGFQSGGTCEYQKSRNYSQAYSIAWGWFSVIVEQINEEPKVIPYGFSYYGSLVGGGTGNLRTGGGSGQIPTIDIKNHRTPGYANVGEIKFPFGDDGDCNPSLAPVPIPIPQNEENLEQQKSPASTPWWENLPSIPIIPIFEWLNPWKRTV